MHENVEAVKLSVIYDVAAKSEPESFFTDCLKRVHHFKINYETFHWEQISGL